MYNYDKLGPNAYTVAAKLRFDYSDSKGQVTQRTVDTKKADDTQRLISGYCHLRQSDRVFRYDRISNCAKIDTGEVIDDFLSWLHRSYIESPEYKIKLFVEGSKDLLKCLLYIGKADGKMTSTKKAIILKACNDVATNADLTEKQIFKILSGIDVASPQAFKLAVGRLSKLEDSHMFDVLLKSVREVVASKKNIHQNEQDAIAFIEKKVSEFQS